MLRLAWLARVLVAGHLVAVLTPCAPSLPDATAGQLDHGAHHASAAGHDHGAAEAADAPPCHAVPPSLVAPCACGCGERSEPASASTGLGVALLPGPSGLIEPEGLGVRDEPSLLASMAPVVGLDHVPLTLV